MSEKRTKDRWGKMYKVLFINDSGVAVDFGFKPRQYPEAVNAMNRMTRETGFIHFLLLV